MVGKSLYILLLSTICCYLGFSESRHGLEKDTIMPMTFFKQLVRRKAAIVKAYKGIRYTRSFGMDFVR
jgi:hypothetical protein